MRLPDREVHEDVRIELGHDVDDAVVVAGHDAVVDGAAEAPPGWIGVDSLERFHPRLVFEQTGDARADLTAHPADEHPLPNLRHE